MRYALLARYWTALLTVVAILTFVAGTSVACLQKGMGNGQIAQACCEGHCHHNLEEVLAVKCCQRHQHNVAQAVPLSLGLKPTLSADSLLMGVPLSTPVIHTHASVRALLFPRQHPPPTLALYTLHCSLLI